MIKTEALNLENYGLKTCFFILKKYFIYLFLFLVVLGLSCSTWDLRCCMQGLPLRCSSSSLWHAGFSLVVVCGFSLSSCGAQAPEHVGSVVVVHGLQSVWAL